ncbi:MAG TPA: LPS assembly lipoprotein LptE [Xanthobacteraceae bacterium]|jgi:LPS-assembly lipoprotein
MSWRNWIDGAGCRLAAIGALSLALAGCFQPMYGELPVGGGPSLRDALRDVEIAEIEGRVGQEIRNDIIFELTGGDGNPAGAPFRLTMTISTRTQTPVIDPTTGISQIDTVGLTVNYRLLDVASKKLVLTDSALARVSVDRSMQRFARLRGIRDAENRAAKAVAQQIRARLATYFLTRT